MNKERQTAGGESAMHGVKGYVVHSIDEGLIFTCDSLITSMALEREVVSYK